MLRNLSFVDVIGSCQLFNTFNATNEIIAQKKLSNYTVWGLFLLLVTKLDK
jgi:hypothetical protein